MKKYYSLILLFFITVVYVSAQDRGYVTKAEKKIKKRINKIHKNEENNLNKKLRDINKQLENKEITKGTSDSLIISASKKTKINIQEKVDAELDDLKRLRAYGGKRIIEYNFLKNTAIAKSIKSIILEEKVLLKKEIAIINDKIETNEISLLEADELKKEASQEHAKMIEDKISKEELKIKKRLQEFTNNQIAKISLDSIEVETKYGNFFDKRWNRKEKMSVNDIERSKQFFKKANIRRHFIQSILAFGLNNVIIDNKVSDDYKIGGSRFYEFGHAFRYRLSENSSPFYLKYGASLFFNNLRLTENRSHVKSGNETNLIVHPRELKNSRLNNVQLVLPVHFEIDFSRPNLFDGLEINTKDRSFKLGLGGYVGTRIYTRQILKYEENGISIKEKSRDNYNINNFTYGVSSYLGYR